MYPTSYEVQVDMSLCLAMYEPPSGNTYRFHMIPDGKLLVACCLSEAPFPCLELCPVFYSSAPYMDQQSKESSSLRSRSGVRFWMASGNGCRTLHVGRGTEVRTPERAVPIFGSSADYLMLTKDRNF